jgi:hypothetical protein
VPIVRLNRRFIPQDEYITDTFAVGAFFVAVISGSQTECTFFPIRYACTNCVNAVAALSTVDFGTTKVRDRQVVTSAAAL